MGALTIKQWEKLIKKALENEGHYRPIFDRSIIVLSEILFERDRIYKQYMEEGGQILIEYESDRGATNKRPNPLLDQWQKLNNTALQYFKELGLTPGGLTKIKGEIEEQKGSRLDLFLNNLEKGAAENDRKRSSKRKA